MTESKFACSFKTIDLPEENRSGVIEITKPSGWAVIDYDLKQYAQKYVTVKLSAEIKRVGAAGDLRWQINNMDFPTVCEIQNAAENVWHNMSGEWTGFVFHPFIPKFYLSTWNSNSDSTTYFIDNFSIEIIPEYHLSYIKSLVLPEIRKDFVIAEPFRNGLTDMEIKAGITSFRNFVYDFHDKMAAEYKDYGAKQAEIFVKYIPALLFFIGFHGKLETEPKKELIVSGGDLLTVPKPKSERTYSLKKLSAKKIGELFEFLSDMGFYFEELNHSEKVDLSNTGQFYVHYENDDNLVVGLKLLSLAAMNMKSERIGIGWDFMRCVYYPLADSEPKNHKIQFNDHIHLLPPDKKDWILYLHNYMTENNCKIDGEIKDFIRFTYTSRKSKKWVAIFEFKPYGFVLRINTNYVKCLDEVTQKLPSSTLTVLRSDGCGCGGACKFGPFRISHGGEEFVSCRYVGFQFSLDNAVEYEILKKWIELELKAS